MRLIVMKPEMISLAWRRIRLNSWNESRHVVNCSTARILRGAWRDNTESPSIIFPALSARHMRCGSRETLFFFTMTWFHPTLVRQNTPVIMTIFCRTIPRLDATAIKHRLLSSCGPYTNRGAAGHKMACIQDNQHNLHTRYSTTYIRKQAYVSLTRFAHFGTHHDRVQSSSAPGRCCVSAATE